MADLSPAHVLSEDEHAQALLQQQVALFEHALAVEPGQDAQQTQALDQAYARISGLRSPLPGLWLVVDARQQVRHANEQAGRLLGIQCRALPGRPLVELLPDAPELLLRVAAHPDGAINVETRFRQYDGEWVPVLLSMAQEQNSDGQSQYVLVGIDLRERRQMELQLRQAQKLEAMGSLAAGMAHEINTPLQFLSDNLGFIDDSCTELLTVLSLARQEARPDGALSQALSRLDADFMQQHLPLALQRSHDGVRRVRDIVNSLRSFAHPSEVAVPEDLSLLLRQALTMTAHDLRQVAEVVLALEPVPLVSCRRDLLVQVLINLLTNAAHAIAERQRQQPGHGCVTLSLRGIKDGRCVQLSVSDDGCGIDDSIRHRIFDPFFTTKPVGQGTGQGLAISRALIVEQHGGALWCEPRAEGGSRFVIELPVAETAA